MSMRSCSLAFAGALVLAGCGERVEGPPARKSKPPAPLASPYPGLGIVPANYPLVDGSTSTEPLQRLMACKITGIGFEWVHLESDDSRRLYANAMYEPDGRIKPDEGGFVRDSRSPLGTFINESIKHRGTHEAFVNLIERRAEFILTSRDASNDERRLAGERGVRLDAVPVALDAFVFLLNTKNPVDRLSLDQIRDIYVGAITRWNSVGGPDEPITPYRRNRNSGSEETMRDLVMQGRPLPAAPDILIGTLMSHTELRLHDHPFGIGYSFYYYHEFMAADEDWRTIKAVAVDGTPPTPETIRARTYPLVTPVWAVIRSDTPAEHPARRLRNWLLGPDGQEAVAWSGYVPVVPEAPEPPARRPEADAARTGDAVG